MNYVIGIFKQKRNSQGFDLEGITVVEASSMADAREKAVIWFAKQHNYERTRVLDDWNNNNRPVATKGYAETNNEVYVWEEKYDEWRKR